MSLIERAKYSGSADSSMIREPWFWHEESLSARLVAGALSPVGAMYHAASKARLQRKNRPSVNQCAVLCIGNATLGGVGKTPFAMMLYRLLSERGLSPAFLSRGYRGNLKGPVKVDPSIHSVTDVGDEALLLAQHGPAWVSKDRVAGLHAAHRAGYNIVLADDGFQNPSLPKDFSFLLVSEKSLSGNQHVFPAGPFREPLKEAARRADTLVFMGASSQDTPSAAMISLAKEKSCYQAAMVPIDDMRQGKVHGFCGIGNPDRFRRTLQLAGYDLTGFTAFPDHHVYTEQNITALRKKAKAESSTLITTTKDYVRLKEEQCDEILTLDVELQVNKPDMMMSAVMKCINSKIDTVTPRKPV